MLLAVASWAADASPETNFLNYGVLGIFTIVMIGLIRILLKREQDRADRMEAEVTRLNGIIQDKTIPALLQATEAVKSSQDFLRNLEYQRKLEEEAQRLKDRQSPYPTNPTNPPGPGA